jgi:hypothetical protein
MIILLPDFGISGAEERSRGQRLRGHGVRRHARVAGQNLRVTCGAQPGQRRGGRMFTLQCDAPRGIRQTVDARALTHEDWELSLATSVRTESAIQQPQHFSAAGNPPCWQLPSVR